MMQKKKYTSQAYDGSPRLPAQKLKCELFVVTITQNKCLGHEIPVEEVQLQQNCNKISIYFCSVHF